MASERHRWVKLKEHTYLCRKCAMGKVNRQEPGGEWLTIWLLPDGATREGGRTPPCEVGPKTVSRLEYYAAALSA